jgi:hypothetical protein
MQRITWLAIAATASLLAHTPVKAAASSSATLVDFTITLYDLDPLDGITPSITFGGMSYSVAYPTNSSPSEYALDYAYGIGPFGSAVVSAATSQSTAFASSTGIIPATIAGNVTVVGSLYANGSANGTTGTLGTDLSRFNAGSSWNYDGNSFSLSARTAALFSASATISASVTTAYSSTWPYNRESASAYALINVVGPGSSGHGSQSTFDQLQVDMTNADNYDSSAGLYLVPPPVDRTVNLGGSFINGTGKDLSGYFDVRVAAYGDSYATSVPEPETYAMLLAGLGVLGFIGKRRRAS